MGSHVQEFNPDDIVRFANFVCRSIVLSPATRAKLDYDDLRSIAAEEIITVLRCRGNKRISTNLIYRAARSAVWRAIFRATQQPVLSPAEPVVNPIAQFELQLDTETLLHKLNAKDRELIARRFGLLGYPPHTFKELAKVFGFALGLCRRFRVLRFGIRFGVRGNHD